ncbi:PAS domain S-box protein [bacterium]|nr:PAS domain S-box protein [bacterium]
MAGLVAWATIILIDTGNHPGEPWPEVLRLSYAHTFYSGLILLALFVVFGALLAFAYLRKIRIEMHLTASDRRRQVIFENVQDAYYETLLDGTLREISPAIEQINGFTREEMIGHNARDFYYDAAERDQLIAAIKKTGKLQDYEILFRSKSGQPVPCAITATRLESPDQDQPMIVGLIRDISQRKRAENLLRLSEAFNRAIIDNSPIGISVRSATGQLLQYNEAWIKIWAMPDEAVREDLETKREKLAFDLRDTYLEQWQFELERVYTAGGSLFIPELKTEKMRPGSAEWVAQHFYALQDDEGRVERVVIMTIDITERKRNADEQARLITQLQDALAEIKTLHGLLPICAHCKKIRDDEGYWNQIESYLSKHSELEFSHSICPECERLLYPEFAGQLPEDEPTRKS